MSNFSIGSRSPDFDIYYAAVDKQTGQAIVSGAFDVPAQVARL
jgi:hypothetical protein